MANSWRRLWKEEVQSGCISKYAAEGRSPVRRGRTCSPEAMGKEDSLKLLRDLVLIAVNTQANTQVCGGLNSIAVGTWPPAQFWSYRQR